MKRVRPYIVYKSKRSERFEYRMGLLRFWSSSTEIR